MPTMKHEYADNALVTLNVDPTLAGWYPYGRDRNPNGGTAFHKLVGANRDLPQMMKILYPEVDLEVIGAPTGHDPTIFPGMLSDRSPMWERARRNTELQLKDAVTVKVVKAPFQKLERPLASGSEGDQQSGPPHPLRISRRTAFLDPVDRHGQQWCHGL